MQVPLFISARREGLSYSKAHATGAASDESYFPDHIEVVRRGKFEVNHRTIETVFMSVDIR